MRALFNFFFFALFLTTTLNLNAQSRKVLRDSSTVIIFNQSSSSTSYKKKKSYDDNIIKIAPLGFISGTFPIVYERKIKDFFSVQISAGLTSKNYFRNAIQSSGDGIRPQYSWGDSYTDISAAPYNFDIRTAKIGTMFSIQPRFYFDSDAPDGNFLGLSVDNYRYNYSIPGITANANSFKQNGADKSEYDNITDFMVHFGKQTVYDKLTFEYTTSIGLRSVSGKRYAAGTNGSTNTILESTSTIKQSILNFNLGIKAGYHF